MRDRLQRRFYLWLRWLTGQTFQRYYRLQVEGLEHWPAQGAAVICPKHQRWEDVPIVGLTFPRPLYYVAKVELFHSLASRRLCEALGGIPLDRRCPQATLSTFRTVLTLLQRREQFVLFPEGTYVPGKVGPGKHRFIQLLLRLQNHLPGKRLPFVPMGITYLPEPPGYRVRVRLGAPHQAAGPEAAAALTGEIMAAIQRLQG
ncbi:MAG: lysophospholipid acyltransferase family protein [Desulfobacca sp.]|uniref:lysophospholipid acyltransferase family protein n=1 Tax=Desulfobacca sp. TaxID=2067990 RepID=UPI00404A4C5C